MSHAGKSKDLAEIASAISKGEMTIDQVMEEAPATYVMYGKGLDALAVASMADRDPSTAPEVFWYYGGTGTGKTRKAYEDNPGIYTWSGQWPWFHGYRGQETVLFDDFRGTIPFCSFLRLLDRYPCTVETKGGYMKVMKWKQRAKKIIITSALQPEDVYDKEKLDRTVYGASRTATTSFFTHHLRLISLAAVIGAALPVSIWRRNPENITSLACSLAAPR